MTDLDELERLLAEATPGPWVHAHTGVGPEEEWTGNAVFKQGGDEDLVCEGWADAMGEPDMMAIVALRNSAGRLLALARAGERLAECRDHTDECPFDEYHPEERECDCGVHAALAAWREVRG